MPAPMFAVGKIGHGDPAWIYDSLHGWETFLARGLHASDTNFHCCAPDPECPLCTPEGEQCPGHPVGAHYATVDDNHMHDPTGRISGNARVEELTLTQIRTLRPKDPKSVVRMDAIEAWFGWAAENNYAVMAEWKPDARTNTTALSALVRFAAKAAAHGVKVAIMILQRAGKDAAAWEKAAIRRAEVANAAGLPVVMLWRRGVTISPAWRKSISAVKSARRWVVIPKGVQRIGTSKAAAPPKARRRRKRRRKPLPRRIRLRRRRRARRKARR